MRCFRAAWASLMNTPTVLTKVIRLHFMTRPWWVLCVSNGLRKGAGWPWMPVQLYWNLLKVKADWKISLKEISYMVLMEEKAITVIDHISSNHITYHVNASLLFSFTPFSFPYTCFLASYSPQTLNGNRFQTLRGKTSGRPAGFMLGSQI